MPEMEELVSGRIVAATELTVPPSGFAAPHRIAIIETDRGERTMAIVEGILPPAGTRGTLRTDPGGRRWFHPGP
jgi:uncharacterized OB-fold protein